MGRRGSPLGLEPLGQAEHEQQQILIRPDLFRMCSSVGRNTAIAKSIAIAQDRRARLMPGGRSQGGHAQCTDKEQTSSNF